MRMFTCFWERFVIGVGILTFLHALIQGVGFGPTILTPTLYLLRQAFLALWVLAFLVSLSMLVRSAWNPNVEPDKGDTMTVKRHLLRLLIFSGVIVITLLLAAFLYFTATLFGR